MSINIGTLDIGVAFAGDTAGLQKAISQAQQGIENFGSSGSRTMRQVREDTKGIEEALARLEGGFKSAVIGSSVAVGLIAIKNRSLEAADAIIQAQVQLDKLNNGFKFGAGGAAGGARELAFVREEANRLGLELGGAATQYMKMVAAARGTNMEGEKTRALFTSIAEASTVMGMSGEQSERAMQAVVQMMSKGKVQAEELRGQLGEHLPGAFAIAARAMGVTEVELNKLMETGQVMSADFLPKFAAQLRNELGGSVEDATKSMQASLNRFETAWLTFKQNVAQTGIAKAMGGEISAISDAITASSDAMDIARKSGATGFMQAMSGIGNAIGRVGFDTLSGSFNVVNSTLNTASLGALNLKTNVDLLPDAFRTSAQQVQLMGQKIVQAEAEYAVLSERLKQAPENIYIKSELTALARYISELERARTARDNLAGSDARQRTGSVSESRISAVSDAAVLASQREKARAYAEFWTKNASAQAQFTAAVISTKEAMGDLFGPAEEAALREKFIKPVRKAKEELDDFTKSAMRGEKLFGDLNATDGGLAGDFAEKWDDLAAAAAKYGKTTDELAAAQAVLLSQQPFFKKGLQDEADALKEQTKANAEAAKVEQTRIDAAEKGAAGVLGKLQSLQDEEKALVIAAAQNISLAQALEEVEIARLRERQAALMREGDRDGEVLAIQEEIEARKKLKAAIGAKEGREAADKAAKEAADAWKKASEQIEKDITDALMRGFESGKNFAMVLRDTVVNMFKTLVLRPIVSAVVSPVAGALTGSLGLAGTANAASGAANLLGGIGSIGSIGGMGGLAESALINSGATYGTGFMSQQSAMLAAQEAGTLGATSSGVMSGLGAIGSTIGAFGTGMAASFTSAVSAGVGGWATAAGSLIGTGTSAGIAAGLGMVAAPLAAAALLWQPMFGRKLKDQGLQGEFGGEAGFTGENYQFYKGGWFRSDKTKTSPLDADMQSGLANQFKAIQLQTALMATALGDTGQSVADFTSSIKVSFNGLTEAQIGEKLTETFTGIANDLAKTVLGDSAFAKEGEAASQTLARLSTSLTTVNATFDTLGFSLEAISLTGADAASDFIDLIGGLDAFKAATAGYYANFYTETERTAFATEQLTEAMGKLGKPLPATRDGFRALVEAAEAAGNDALLAGLLNLQDEFAALTPTVEAAATAVAKANEQALASQSADRKAELAARRAAEAQAAEAMAETLRVYQEGAEQFDTLRQSLLLAGDAAGLLAATTERAFANPNGKYTAGGVQYDAPQWTETTTAAQFNYAYGVMAARLRRDLSDDLSANALRVQNVGPALSKLSVGNMLGQYDPVTGAAAQGIATALAEQVGSVASAAFGPVALAVAQRQTGTAYGAAGPGLASVFAAQRQASFDGNDDRAYSFALAALSETMRTGKLDAEQYATALDTLNSALPEAAAAFGNVEVQAARAAATAGAIGQAGLASIQFYFGQLGTMVEELAAAAAEAAEPIAQASAAIGRFNSASTAFSLSARAALQLQNADETGQALLGASAGTISKSALIAEAAAIASGLVTTADAARVQEQTGLSRDAALLIDGVRAYDAESLEKAFLRTSDALVKGTITEGEYATLFNTSLDIFQDVEAQSAELTRTFDALRDAAKSLADELLLDKNLSTLSGPQQLEEAQRQYRETLAAAFEGDAQAAQSLGGVAETMLGIAQATAGNGTDYARIFGATVADARQLEAIQTPTLPVYQSGQDETVRELRALREEVAALRADQREGLAQVASGTNTTAKRLNEWTNNGLPATETV